MTIISIKGHEIKPITIKDSSTRRAQQFANNIISVLRKIKVHEDDIEIPLERFAIKRAKASASWYVDGQHLYFSYDKGRFVDNLYIVWQVIEKEVELVLNGTKTIYQFVDGFHEDEDIEKQRIEARKTLGLEKDTKDIELINKTYKELAKKYHPDTATGDIEMFKKVNKAHKILKKELIG